MSMTSPSVCDALSKFICWFVLYSLPLRQLIQPRPAHRQVQLIPRVPLPHQFLESLARPAPPTINDTPQQTGYT